MNISQIKRQEYDRLKTSIPEQRKQIRNLKNKFPAKNLERFLIREKRRFDQLHALFETEVI